MLTQQAMMDALTEYGYAPPDRGIKEDAVSHHSGEFCQFVDPGTPMRRAHRVLFPSNDADAAVLADDRRTRSLARHVARAHRRVHAGRREAGTSSSAQPAPPPLLNWPQRQRIKRAERDPDIAAINERVRAQSGFVEAVKREVAAGHRRPGHAGRAADHRHAVPRAHPHRGRAGAGKDAHRQHDGASARRLLRTHPVHARSAAGGHHRHDDLQPAGRPVPRAQGADLPNIVLADEINRAPAKVQSALLEAMQERQVSIGGQSFRLEDPFMVLATQNPIEHEGTYALPEAQLDRFMLKVHVTYPTREEEKRILDRFVAPGAEPQVRAVAGTDAILVASALRGNCAWTSSCATTLCTWSTPRVSRSRTA
jgi:hypothetical protein